MPDGQILIGGEWRPAFDGQRLPVVDPSDGTAFANLARGGAEDVDAAVDAAHAALEGAWGRMAATERGRLLAKLAEAVLEDLELLAGLEARDTGKPLSQGRADIEAAARYFEFYGGAADKVHGQTLPYQDGTTVFTLQEPHGVTGHIIPWNYPAQILGRSLGAALAMGNAAVVKPGEDACLSVLHMAQLAQDVGFPDGAVNVVTGLGMEAGAALAAHPGIDHVSFTGSPETGSRVAAAAAGHHCPVTLELGGKSPQVVFADAGLDAAVPVITRAIVQNGGQTCSAGSRLLVERPVYEEVLSRMVESFAELEAGPWDADLDCGPLINEHQMERVLAYLARAGQVYVNNYGAGGGIELRFGGVKKSGYGREKGFAALGGFAALKTVVLRHG